MSEGLRIVDAVFGRAMAERREKRHIAMAVGVGVGLHASAVVWATLSAPSLETWSAELATHVHAELTRRQEIELPLPPPPPPPPSQQPPSPPTPSETTKARRAAVEKAARPTTPAQAGRVLAADQSAAADFRGTTFVTGTAANYAGGTTSSGGQSTTAVTGPVGGGSQGNKGGDQRRKGLDLASPVVVEEADWDIPWPGEAEEANINEQFVTIQMRVLADGRVESVRVLGDPGFGFAAAAKNYALTLRLPAAHDRDGHPVDAWSPTVRIHFQR